MPTIRTIRPTTPTTVPHTKGMAKTFATTSGDALNAVIFAPLAMPSHCSTYEPAGTCSTRYTSSLPA